MVDDAGVDHGDDDLLDGGGDPPTVGDIHRLQVPLLVVISVGRGAQGLGPHEHVEGDWHPQLLQSFVFFLGCIDQVVMGRQLAADQLGQRLGRGFYR